MPLQGRSGLSNIIIGNSTSNPVNSSVVSGFPIGNGVEHRIRAARGLLPFLGGNGGRTSYYASTTSNNPITTTRRTFGMPVESNFDIHSFLTTPAQLQIASTSANDTSAGTGARTIGIIGLDGNYDNKFEIITLNGQTPVTTTDSDWFRINYMYVDTAGSSGYNNGAILVSSGDTFVAGVPQTQTLYGIASSPSATEIVNNSGMFVFTVPNNQRYWGIVGNYYTSARESRPLLIEEYYSADFGNGKLTYLSGDLGFTSPASFDFRGAGNIGTGTDFWHIVSTTTGTIKGSVFYNLVVENTNVVVP